MTQWLHHIYHSIFFISKTLVVPFFYLTAPLRHVIHCTGRALWWPFQISTEFEVCVHSAAVLHYTDDIQDTVHIFWCSNPHRSYHWRFLALHLQVYHHGFEP